MIALKLAVRNLLGAGLRTWLNVIVLSFVFVMIIWHKGFLDGWDRQARRDTIDWEIGGGQFWHPEYDPFDLFTIADSHGPMPEGFGNGIESGRLTPVLIAQATIYPEDRIQSAMLKGIDPGQTILEIPSGLLTPGAGGRSGGSPGGAGGPDATASDETGREETGQDETAHEKPDPIEAGPDEIPVLIGTRMASGTRLDAGDVVSVRWRDDNGAFDAADARIVGIFKTNVPAVDNGQLWVPLEMLREMIGAPGEATLVVSSPDATAAEAGVAGASAAAAGWVIRSQDDLLAEIDQIIRQKSVGGAIIYVLLLSLALLAVFNTQVLSIFRRQREIGTIIALGMTRGQVIRLFTLEGAMHAVLATGAAAVYGVPFLAFQAVRGFSLPPATDSYGLAVAETIFPVYSAGLVLGTVFMVLVAATIVSFLPARKISRMKPTDAIRGKLQ